MQDLGVNDFTSSLAPGQIAPALFQVLPDVIFWMKDADGRFVFVNKAFSYEVAMRDDSEILGLKDEDVFPRELAAKYQADDRRIRRWPHRGRAGGEPVARRSAC